MDQPVPTRPRVTLVMTVRERHRLTVRAIEQVLANTPIAFRFIFSHGALPPWLDGEIDRLARTGSLERRSFPELHWPHHLRLAVLPEIDTEFVVFIDNDILVSPGWLERLVDCADATGASVVGPTYLWGDGESAPKVHMAGGMLREARVEGGKVMEELHRHMDADPEALREAMKRGPCDFVEYHCMLVRTEIARSPGVIDAEIVAAHDHIDTSLGAKALGGATYFEPSSDVTYMAFAPQVLEDLQLMRSRWDETAVEASIAAFCRKWGVLPDDRSFGGVRGYIRDLRWRHDPLRKGAPGTGLDLPMATADLCQTRTALVELALARGCAPAELAMLGNACQLAAMLVDGGYRPCGRPFINHLLGTAGVLMRYDLGIETVCEGLLHSAYTHCRAPVEAVRDALTRVHPQVEARVRDYTQRGTAAGGEPGNSSARDAEVAAIRAANEIDMRLSGEYLHSGRPPEIDAEHGAYLGQMLDLIGVPGMGLTLRESMAAARAVPAELVTNIAVSYRFAPGGKLVPMVLPR